MKLPSPEDIVPHAVSRTSKKRFDEKGNAQEKTMFDSGFGRCEKERQACPVVQLM